MRIATIGLLLLPLTACAADAIGDWVRGRALVDQLRDQDPDVRAEAVRALRSRQPAVNGLLQQHVGDADPEVASWCRQLLSIEKSDWEWYRDSSVCAIDLQVAECEENGPWIDIDLGCFWGPADTVRALRHHDATCEIRPDGSVHCGHGRPMRVMAPEAIRTRMMPSSMLEASLLDLLRHASIATGWDFAVTGEGRVDFLRRREAFDLHWRRSSRRFRESQDETIETVIRLLQSDDVEVRERAAETLVARSGQWNKDDIAKLEAASQSADADLRERATEALSRVHFRRSVSDKLLAKLPDADRTFVRGQESGRLKVLQEAAALWKKRDASDEDLRALAEFAGRQPWTSSQGDFCMLIRGERVQPYVAVLPVFLKSREAAVRREAADVLVALCPDGFIAELLPLLRDGDAYVRRRGIEALMACGARDRIADILPLLKDSDTDVRKSAAHAIGWLGDRSHGAHVAALMEEVHGGVQREASLALLRLRDDGQAKRISDLLRAREPWKRATAAETLGYLGASRYAENIAALLADDDQEVRIAATAGLGAMGARDAAPGIAALLSDSMWFPRAWAARSLAWLGSREHEDGIAALLDDSDPFVRTLAARALGDLDAKANTARIAKLAKDDTGGVRAAGAQALAELTRGARSPELRPFLEGIEPHHKGFVAQALGTAQGGEHVEILVPLLRDPSEWVRGSAARALADLGAHEHADKILPLLEETNDTARAMAVLAVGELGTRLDRKRRDAVAGRIETLERDSSADVAFCVSIALIRLGRRNVRAQADVLRVIFAPRHQWYASELLDAFSQCHTGAAYDKFAAPFVLQRTIESWDDLMAVVKDAGLKLEGVATHPWGRKEKGSHTSVRRLLQRIASLAHLALFVDGETVRLTTWSDAIQIVSKRLRE